MNNMIAGFQKGLKIRSEAKKGYRALRKHFNTMPIGYPATITGVELRLLEAMFTIEEAQAALHLTWHPETFEQIFARARTKGYAEEKFRQLLASMADKGSIFSTTSGDQIHYACHPLVVGMYEMRLKRMTPGFYLDLRDYFMQGFSIELLTSEVRQMRVVPIQQSVTPQLSIAAYDDIRQIIDQTKDRIVITDCICRVAKDSIGKSCKASDRREVCMGFRDYHDMYVHNGWGRSISPKEALEILDQNEKDGSVLMPTTAQEPQFVCSCCGCCCGVIEMVSMMPRPVDFVASNYHAVLNPQTCIGCKRCQKRCQMNAISFEGKEAVSIDEKRCIGCGLCVSTCKSKSLTLARKESVFIPPKDLEDLYSVIDCHKKSDLGKFAMMAKAMLGFKV